MEEKGSKGRVLVVDDDELICAYLTDALKFFGYECQSSTRGESALEIMRRETFDAVILDLVMPGITGPEVLALVRKTHPQTAFIILTGLGKADVAVGAMKQGADDYLLKPCKPETLVASVDRAINSKRTSLAAADTPPNEG